jgi:hypothetical protein
MIWPLGTVPKSLAEAVKSCFWVVPFFIFYFLFFIFYFLFFIFYFLFFIFYFLYVIQGFVRLFSCC